MHEPNIGIGGPHELDIPVCAATARGDQTAPVGRSRMMSKLAELADAAKPIALQTLTTGSAASFLSMLVLALRARKEGRSHYHGINAVSHWLWGDRALRQHKPSWRYTLPGLAIHHLSAMFWAGGLAALTQQKKKAETAGNHFVSKAIATTAVAWFVDYHLTPKRLTPGFEHVVSRRSRFMIYSAFAAGLAVGALKIKKPTS